MQKLWIENEEVLHKNALGTFSQRNVSVTDPRISFDALK